MAIYSWFTYYKWWFSIVMLVYQGVSGSKFPQSSTGSQIRGPPLQLHPQGHEETFPALEEADGRFL